MSRPDEPSGTPGRRDPLDLLREAWRELPVPAPDADADGEPADELTRRSVEWMRAAWAEVRPERVATPPRGRLASLRRPAPRLLVGAAAALALLLGGALVARALRGAPGPDARRARVASVEVPSPDEVPAPDDVPPHPGSRGSAPATPGVPSSPTPDPAQADARASGPQITAVTPDHLELRSGPVRLILLRPEAN